MAIIYSSSDLFFIIIILQHPLLTSKHRGFAFLCSGVLLVYDLGLSSCKYFRSLVAALSDAKHIELHVHMARGH